VAGVVILVCGILFVASRDSGSPIGTPGSPTATTTSTTGATGATGATTTPGGAPTPATMTVTIYFHHGPDPVAAQVTAVTRTVPASPTVATAALTQLLGGPTGAERDAGYVSYFSSATAGMLVSVRIANGVAHADFRDFSGILPSASSSYGGLALLTELDTTLMHFPTARGTVYSFDGNVARFYEWLQLVPPTQDQGDQLVPARVAQAFASRVLGMTGDPVSGPLRRGSGAPQTAEVDLYPRSVADDSPVTGAATTVSLQASGDSWWVTGARTGTIVAGSPAAGQVISSPVTLSGRAQAFEGTVTVRVVQGGGPASSSGSSSAVRELGRGFVTGGGDVPRPFHGAIGFAAATDRDGWVLLFEESAASGQVFRATAVPVRFGTPAPPSVLGLATAPRLPITDGWLTLPPGEGTVTLTVTTTGAGSLRFALTPTRTDTAPARALGTGTRTADGFGYTWHYPDEPLLAHLVVVADGPGGGLEQEIVGVYHG
jgi:hypothetical protein